MAGQGSGEFEYDELSEYLKALASPNRLELLYQLRFPRTAGEITLTPKRNESEGNPERLISRQAVERHLGVLENIGVVRTHRAQRDGRTVEEYVVNHSRLFQVVEEMRKLTTIKPFAQMDPLATQGNEALLPGVSAQPAVKGPRLVLVGGVYEGRAFSLEPRPGRDAWTIGRHEEADVRLDYDPFCSQDNSRVVLVGGRYFVEDNSLSRNGTLLNYQPMPRGSRVPLETGDLIGVGRSILLFRGH